MRRGSVWITEDDDSDEEDFGVILTGRFSGLRETGGTRKAAWGGQRPDQDVGWFASHRAAYRLVFQERAPSAVEQALRRCEAPGWTVKGDARPR